MSMERSHARARTAATYITAPIGYAIGAWAYTGNGWSGVLVFSLVSVLIGILVIAFTVWQGATGR